MLQRIRERLAVFEPVDLWLPECSKDEAAVLIALTEEPRPKIILTKRAEHLASHRGEVALPGGKRDPVDRTLIETALRETEEEIALPPGKVAVLGCMDPMVTRFGVKVTPVVGLIPVGVPVQPNLAELDSVFYVPLEFFLRDERVRTDRGMVNGHQLEVPCWQWEQYQIWGVTAVIIVNFLNRIFDMEVETGMETLARKTGGMFSPSDWKSA